MSILESALSSALHHEAEEIAMDTDMNAGRSAHDARLDHVDAGRRRRRWVAGLAAAAVVVAVLALVISVVRPGAAPVPPVQQPEPEFSSTTFGVPFTTDLPEWTDELSSTTSPTAEDASFVTWNRCPDPAVECIGLSFNRYTAVIRDGVSTPVTSAAGYVAHLEALASDGAIAITGREATTIDGRAATVLSITGVDDLPSGLGCHGDGSCDQFFPDVPGRYAVVDTGSLDPEDAVLVLWIRAGAVAAAEVGWLADFDDTLTSFRFVGDGS